jgi:hypothetical protein
LNFALTEPELRVQLREFIQRANEPDESAEPPFDECQSFVGSHGVLPQEYARLHLRLPIGVTAPLKVKALLQLLDEADERRAPRRAGDVATAGRAQSLDDAAPREGSEAHQRVRL